MRSCPECSSPSAPPPAGPSPPSIFSPEFLARLREQDETPTASESDLAGPWWAAVVPGRPGWFGVLRVWENLAAGDVPPRVVRSGGERAALCRGAPASRA